MPKDIILVEDGRDTIGEAFASRSMSNKLKVKKILLVTSDKHMKRALWIFRRIFDKSVKIDGKPVSCGKLLNEDEEKEYFEITYDYFQKFPKNISNPKLDVWIQENKWLYEKFKQIHDKYHPLGGPRSQAYSGIREDD